MSLPQLGAVVAGNALEFYDFLTFSFFAVQIGTVFFPGHDATGSLLLTLATFGVGFLTRPLGGAVIGPLGDRIGRKPAMLFSFGLMGLSIVGLALTPSYASIGTQPSPLRYRTSPSRRRFAVSIWEPWFSRAMEGGKITSGE